MTDNKIENDIVKLKAMINALNTRLTRVEIDNKRLKHLTHQQKNEIALLHRKQ